MHPHMHATQQQKRDDSTRGGGRTGMMGAILPIYAVGIVVYLLYTLSKVGE